MALSPTTLSSNRTVGEGTFWRPCQDTNLESPGTVAKMSPPQQFGLKKVWLGTGLSFPYRLQKFPLFLSSSYRLQKFADTDRLRVNRRPIRKDFFPDRYDFVPIVFTSCSCKRALYSHLFATQSSPFVDRAWWQAKMAPLDFGYHDVMRTIPIGNKAEYQKFPAPS